MFIEPPRSISPRSSVDVDVSPWSYIQSVSRTKPRRVDVCVGMRGGRGEGGGKSGRKRQGHHSAGNSSGSENSRVSD